jgi:hypothetical protein
MHDDWKAKKSCHTVQGRRKVKRVYALKETRCFCGEEKHMFATGNVKLGKSGFEPGTEV